jgi:predicted ATPase
MLTRLEISGFKSFQDFAIDLRPFQVFIGPNGVGKTNLFDAISLLADLAGDTTLDNAFRHSRGELSELFTQYADGGRAKTMTFAAEMLLPRVLPAEGLSRAVELTNNRLRYELVVGPRADNPEKPTLLRESLTAIPDSSDKWAKDEIPSKSRKAWIKREKRPPYIATTIEDDKGKTTIHRNQDGIAGGREGALVGTLERTMLSSADGLRYPTINAARLEMRNWRFLQLNSQALRLPGKATGQFQNDGANLAALVARIADAGAIAGVVKDMKGLIPAINTITTRPIPDRGEVVVEVETQDKSKFSSRVLSDGTLRLLTLVSLKNNPAHRGVLCFEEPENGVQPLRLKQILDVLIALSTNIADETPGEDSAKQPPLRQVLVTTHSPTLLAHVPGDCMYYVDMKSQPDGKGRATRVVPVKSELLRSDDETYFTWEQVSQYLDADAINKKRDELGL